MTTTTELTQATAAAYHGFTVGNLEPLFSMLHEQVSWTYHGNPQSPFAGRHTGVEGVQAVFGNLPALEIERFEVKQMIQENHTIVVLVDTRQTLKATGETHDGQEVHVIRFEGDKIREMNLYPPSIR